MNPHLHSADVGQIGGPDWIRTSNQVVMSDVLCR